MADFGYTKQDIKRIRKGIKPGEPITDVQVDMLYMCDLITDDDYANSDRLIGTFRQIDPKIDGLLRRMGYKKRGGARRRRELQAA